eukprot:6175867-Pleurochrysis_carterae.AAC.2
MAADRRLDEAGGAAGASSEGGRQLLAGRFVRVGHRGGRRGQRATAYDGSSGAVGACVQPLVQHTHTRAVRRLRHGTPHASRRLHRALHGACTAHTRLGPMYAVARKSTRAAQTKLLNGGSGPVSARSKCLNSL